MDILELMLADPRFHLDNVALEEAFDAKRPDILARLLQDPRIQPNVDEVLMKVHGFYNMGDPERAKMFLPVILADPRFTQGQPQHYLDYLFGITKQLQTPAPRFGRR